MKTRPFLSLLFATLASCADGKSDLLSWNDDSGIGDDTATDTSDTDTEVAALEDPTDFNEDRALSVMPHTDCGLDAPAGLGYAVSSAGDINGDGYADVLAGAPDAAEGGGVVCVLYGTADRESWPGGVSSITSSDAASWLGLSVQSAGDVDGDGYADIALGSPAWDGAEEEEGAGLVFFGPRTAGDTWVTSQADLTLTGPAYGSNAGAAIAIVQEDAEAAFIAVGAIESDGGALGSPTARGVVYLVPSNDVLMGGSAVGLGDNIALSGESWADHAGWALASGDTDGDGMGDLLVGAPDWDGDGVNRGRVYLIRDDITMDMDLDDAADVMFTGVSDDDNAGHAVAVMGDQDGDGRDDIAIGAPGHDPRGRDGAGAVYVFVGGLRGALDLTDADAVVLGASGGSEDGQGDRIGFSIASVPDATGDGVADLLLGAYGDDGGGSESGAAYLVPGPILANIDLSEEDAALKATGESAGGHAGWAVGFAGDVDADGLGDLLVGAPDSNHGQGTVYPLFGASPEMQEATRNPRP